MADASACVGAGEVKSHDGVRAFPYRRNVATMRPAAQLNRHESRLWCLTEEDGWRGCAPLRCPSPFAHLCLAPGGAHRPLDRSHRLSSASCEKRRRAEAPPPRQSSFGGEKKKRKKKKCKVKCAGKVCGPSNCKKKSCGACTGNDQCNAAGQCVCVPQCGGKQCGPDGCDGECQPGCALGTHCNGQGHCVDCVSDDQCALTFCKSATCSNGTCQYTDLPDNSPCLLDNVCCGGECVDTQTDPDNCNACGDACAPQGDSCAAGHCTCGGGAPCPPGATCESGQCVCPQDQVLCLNECVSGTCCAVGKGCFDDVDCCLSGNNPDQTSCENNVCGKNPGSTCNNSNECCSGFCDTAVTHQCS